MANSDSQLNRLAIITELVQQAPGGFGRTALMKCLFFLKTLRNVPLPYSFRLYTYGPFDAEVLDDLRYAETLGAVQSSVIPYPGGYGYEFRPGPQAKWLEEKASDFISNHRQSIEWVVREFGRRSALDLEMASTLIYVDRAFAQRGDKVPITELAKMVHEVKPHLEIGVIEREAQDLSERGLLKAAA